MCCVSLCYGKMVLISIKGNMCSESDHCVSFQLTESLAINRDYVAIFISYPISAQDTHISLRAFGS